MTILRVVLRASWVLRPLRIWLLVFIINMIELASVLKSSIHWGFRKFQFVNFFFIVKWLCMVMHKRCHIFTTNIVNLLKPHCFSFLDIMNSIDWMIYSFIFRQNRWRCCIWILNTLNYISSLFWYLRFALFPINFI
jgi:hypothetical protein